MLNLKLIIISCLLLSFSGCFLSSVAIVPDNTNITIDNLPIDDDPLSGSGNIRIIDNDHWHIHKGEHWVYSDIFTLQATNNKYYYLDFRNTTQKAHMIFTIIAKSEGIIYIYENTNVSNNGILQNQTNRNRLYPDTNNLIVYEDPTIVTNGDLIYNQYIGSGNKFGGEFRGTNEFVLNCSNQYLIRTYSIDNSNTISIVLDWYD